MACRARCGCMLPTGAWLCSLGLIFATSGRHATEERVQTRISTTSLCVRGHGLFVSKLMQRVCLCGTHKHRTLRSQLGRRPTSPRNANDTKEPSADAACPDANDDAQRTEPALWRRFHSQDWPCPRHLVALLAARADGESWQTSHTGRPSPERRSQTPSAAAA